MQTLRLTLAPLFQQLVPIELQSTLTVSLPSDEDRLLSNLERVGIKLSSHENCIISEVHDAPYLEHWRGEEANTDELNLLARLLEQMDDYERQVFAAVMSAKQYDFIDAIDLTFNLNRFVVVDKILDKAEAGRRLVNTSEVDADNLSEEELIKWGEELHKNYNGAVTPWGVLFELRPGKELEQHYNGLELPTIELDPTLWITVATPRKMYNLDLPCSDAYLQSTLLRLGLESWENCNAWSFKWGSGLKEFETLLDVSEEFIPDLNRMCRAIKQALPHGEKLLSAALEYTQAQGAAEVAATVDAAASFELYEWINDAEALGRHIFPKILPGLATHPEFQEVTDIFPYDRFGEDYAELNNVHYLSCGAVAYTGEQTIDQLLGRDVQDHGAQGISQ